MATGVDSDKALRTCARHGLQFDSSQKQGCILCAREKKQGRAEYNTGVALGTLGALTAIGALVSAVLLLDLAPGSNVWDGPETVTVPQDSAPPAPVVASAAAVPHRERALPLGDRATGFTVVDMVTSAAPPQTYVDKARNTTVLVRSPFGRGMGFFVTWDCKVLTARQLVASDRVALIQAEAALLELKQRAWKAAKKGDTSLTEMATTLGQELARKRQVMAEEKIDPKRIQILTIDGQQYRARKVTLSENRDLALLELDLVNVCPVAERGDQKPLAPGTPLYSVTNPSGYDYAVTGSRFVKNQKAPQGGPWLHLDNPAEASGSPIVTDQGQIVGMRTQAPEGVDDVGVGIPLAALGWEFNVPFGSGPRSLPVKPPEPEQGAQLAPVNLEPAGQAGTPTR